MVLGSRFNKDICRIVILGQLWRTAVGYRFGAQCRGRAFGSSFGQFSGPAFRQLRAATLEFWGGFLKCDFR